MKVSKKLLSMFLAVVMLLSIVPVLSVAVKPYKDSAITKYDDADKPVFTVDQNASMLLDYLDKTLSESAAEPTDIPIVNVRLDLTSVNGLLNTLTGLQKFKDGFLGAMAKLVIGDIMDFNFDAVKGNQRGKTEDLTIIYNVIQTLNDNWALLEKLVTAQLDLGLLGSLVGNEINAVLGVLDVTFIFKMLLHAIAYPGVDLPMNKDDFDITVDQMVQDGVLSLVGVIAGEEYEDMFRPSFNINNPDSAYDFVYGMIAAVYDNLIVPAFNEQLKDMVRGACGIDTIAYPHNVDVPANIAAGSIYAAVIDVNFKAPPLDLAGGDIVSTINFNLGRLFEAVLKNYTAWNYGDNTKILENITAALKHAWVVTDGKIIPDTNGYTPKTRAEVDSMDSQQVVSYVLRSLLNTYDPETILPGQESMLATFLRDLPTLYIPDDATNITRVLWYTSQQVANHYLPKQNYAALAMSKNKDDVQSVMNILADLIAYGLNKTGDSNVAAKAAGAKPQDNAGLLPYGAGFDKTLTLLMQKLNDMVLPLFNLKFDINVNDPMSGWKALDTLVFALINKNWLPNDVTNKTYIMKELIQNRVLEDLCDLDLNRMLSLVDKKVNTQSDLYRYTIKQNLFLVMRNAINSIFPNALSDRTSTGMLYVQSPAIFDEMIKNENLLPMLKNVLSQLNTRKTALAKTLLPLLAQVMKVNAPQALGSMTVTMPRRIAGAADFTIRNNSTGVNTGYTDANGKFKQDKLYTYVVTNYRIYQNAKDGTRTENSGITIAGIAKNKTADTGTVINGGTVFNAKLQGTFPATKDLNLCVELDYLIRDEDGKVISATPLTKRIDTFYTNEVKDDNQIYTSLGKKGNITASVPKAYFREYDDSLEQIATTFDVQMSRSRSLLGLSGNITVASAGAAITDAKAKLWIRPNPRDTAIVVNDSDITVLVFPFAAEKDVVRTKFPMERMMLNVSLTASGQSEAWNAAIPVHAYNDFGLIKAYDDELLLNRQAGDYSDTAKWNAYLKAMARAAFLLQRPKRDTDFQTVAKDANTGFEKTERDLDAAVKALNGVKKASTHLTDLKKKLDAYNYKKQSVDYDNAKYVFDGEMDFVPYTYNNYAAAITRGNEIYVSAVLANPPVSYDVPTLLNTAKYIDLMRSRRIRITSTDARLKETLAMCKSKTYAKDFYTASTWAAYEKALNFTNAVLGSFNASTTPSSKLSEARFRLLKAWKNLEFNPTKNIYIAFYEHLDVDNLPTSTAVRVMQGKAVTKPADPHTKTQKFTGWTAADIPATMPNHDIVVKAAGYVPKTLTGLAVTAQPANVLKGQALDLSKIVFTAKYDNGTAGDETGMKGNASGVTVSGYNANTVGTQTITVTWKKSASETASTTFQLSVYAKLPSSVKVSTMPTKVSYGAGQALSLAGGKITVTYTDKSTAVFNMTDAKVKVTGYSSSKAASQTLTLTFTESGTAKTTTFAVKVLAAPTSLKMNRASAAIGVKDSVTLSAAPTPAAAATFLTWTSSDKKIATVSSAGKVTGVKAGTATITATAYNKVKISCKVTVKAAPGSVKTNVAARTVGKGDTYQLSAVCPANTASAANTWKSSNTKIATVDKNGLVKGIAAGTAKITLTTFNKKTAVCTVTVKNAPGSVKLNVTSRTLGKGETYKLTAALPANTAGKMTWSSASTKIATVDASGNVKAAAEGTAKITVKTFNGKTASCTITVKKAPGSVKLNTASVTLGAKETFQLSAALPSGTASNKRTWSSNNTKVAKVDANGKITAVAVGTAKITVKTFNGKTATCTVTVKKAPTGVKLNAASKTMTKGAAYQLSILLPSGTASNKRTWTSSDTKIAKVDAKGKVTAVAKGTATITVKTYNGKTTTCKITVK